MTIDNTTSFMSPQSLENYSQVHFLNGRSFSFHTSLAFSAFHFFFLLYHRYQTLPFFSFALLIVRFLVSFNLLPSFFFSFFFYLSFVIFIQLYLPHNTWMRSAASSSSFMSTSFKVKSAKHASLVGSTMSWTFCGVNARIPRRR